MFSCVKLLLMFSDKILSRVEALYEVVWSLYEVVITPSPRMGQYQKGAQGRKISMGFKFRDNWEVTFYHVLAAQLWGSCVGYESLSLVFPTIWKPKQIQILPLIPHNCEDNQRLSSSVIKVFWANYWAPSMCQALVCRLCLGYLVGATQQA